VDAAVKKKNITKKQDPGSPATVKRDIWRAVEGPINRPSLF
jgi:hypothetical protein